MITPSHGDAFFDEDEGCYIHVRYFSIRSRFCKVAATSEVPVRNRRM